MTVYSVSNETLRAGATNKNNNHLIYTPINNKELHVLKFFSKYVSLSSYLRLIFFKYINYL